MRKRNRSRPARLPFIAGFVSGVSASLVSTALYLAYSALVEHAARLGRIEAFLTHLSAMMRQ